MNPKPQPEPGAQSEPQTKMKTQTQFFQTCLAVFQGGGCRGPAFVGAIEEAQARGVDFAGAAGTSAGAIVAALVGAGATPAFVKDALSQLDFASLLEAPEPIPTSSSVGTRIGLSFVRGFLKDAVTVWEYHGLYSSRGLERWLREQLQKLLGPKDVLFRDLPIPTFIVAADIFTNDVKVWSSATTPDDSVAYAARCSSSIPGFFQPVAGRYIDGGVLSNLPTFVFSTKPYDQDKPFASRILAFSLVSPDKSTEPQSSKELFEATVNTIIGGASSLQGRLVPSVHNIEIDTGEIQATDFLKMNNDKIDWLIGQGKKATEDFFDHELAKVKGSRQQLNILFGNDEVYSEIIESSNTVPISDVVISDYDTRWAYALFGTLLAWRHRGVRLRVLLPKATYNDQQAYQRRLLRALGAELFMTDDVPGRSFLMNPTDKVNSRAIVFADVEDTDVALRYSGPLDFPVILALWKVISTAVEHDPKCLTTKPTIAPVSSTEILDRLKQNVGAYSTQGVQLTLEPVFVKDIWLMTRMIRAFKFKQIDTLFQLFDRVQIKRFEAAAVSYGDQLSTLVTPPVVEVSGDRFILVQGNARAFYCLKNGIDILYCVVARNVTTPLPSDQQVALKEVLIGDRTIESSIRYGSDIDKDYRNIEWATHRPEQTLLGITI